jgi:hypothetical protein
MATAFEGGCEELIHDLTSHVVVNETTWHHQDVSIVVLTDEVGYLRYPTEACTYLLVLVERHGDTLARTADGYAGIYLTALDALSKCMTEVGIVD